MKTKTKLRIVPYKSASASAKALSLALNEIGVKTKRVARDSQTYVTRSSHKYLNWGCPILPHWNGVISYPWDVITNHPVHVATATNKLYSFAKFKEYEVPTPDWTTDIEVAKVWVSETPVVCRTILNGSGGVGIIIANNPDEVCQAPLYVKYKKKKKEFRIHVFNGKVIDVQQKRKRSGADANPLIRNLSNGWVFCRGDVELPHDASDAAILAVASLGLTFGAVDVIFNQLEDKTYVLEVNSAPGLEGETVMSYANAIKEYINAD